MTTRPPANDIDYRELFRAAADALFLIDNESGAILEANDAAAALYGYTRDELLTLTNRDLSAEPAETERATKSPPEDLSRPVAIPVRRHRKKDGTVFPVEITARFLTSGGRSVHLADIRDITERATAEAALREREDKFRFLWSRSVVPKSITRPNGEVEVNSAFCAMLGYTPEELADRATWMKLTYPDDVAESQRRIDALLTGKRESSRYEKRFVRKDGSIVWADLSTSLRHTEAGEPLYFMTTIIDITERKRAEDALRESEQRFRAMFDLNPDAAVIASLKDSRIVDANQAFCAQFGYTPEEATGKTPVDLGLFVDIEVRNRLFAQAQAQGGYANEEVEFRTRSGATFTALASTRVVSLNGEPHLYTTARDITDRQLAEDAVRRLNTELEARVATRTAELESAVAELESFAYSVSHDLRAPLRALDGYSLIVMEDYGDKLDEEARHDLERIRAGAQTMATLIDGLLELSRLNRGHITRREVDLGALARDIVEGLREADPERDVEAVIADGLIVSADPDLTRVLLANLLGNAWKFTAKHEHARIEVGLLGAADAAEAPATAGGGDAGAGERVFFVRDDGAGFDMAYVDKLFGPFQRLHNPREFTGTGIGLATVQRIVRRHGGRVWAEAEVEKGATFFFTLPTAADTFA